LGSAAAPAGVLLVVLFPDALGLRMALYSETLLLASGLPRLLLPLCPTALACVAAGFELTLREKWKLASGTAPALVGVMVVASAAGFVRYVHKPLRAVPCNPKENTRKKETPSACKGHSPEFSSKPNRTHPDRRPGSDLKDETLGCE
jgi:hypothetical protein